MSTVGRWPSACRESNVRGMTLPLLEWSCGYGIQIRPSVAIGIWTADNFRLSRVLPQTIDRTSHGHHPREGECVKTRPSQLRC